MIYLLLGGNVGTPAEIATRFAAAREALEGVQSSSLYRSAAIGPSQPDYFNAAISVAWTDPQPDEVIARVLETERGLGRDRRGEKRWGPREIDIDVLWWKERPVVDHPGLQVPHPRLFERRFALLPLLELIKTPQLVAAEAAVRDQRVDVAELIF